MQYALFYWLPYYLTITLDYNKHFANILSTLYDFGGVFGSLAGGALSDMLPHRSFVALPSLAIGVAMLLLYRTFAASGAAVNGVLMFAVGTFVSGYAYGPRCWQYCTDCLQ